MKGILFDCDGVLLDSIGAWHDLDDKLARDAGLTITPEDRDVLNASTLEEAAAFFHEHYGLGRNVAEVEQRFNDFLLDFYRNEAEANPGAVAFVDAVAQAGYELCVLSSSPKAFLEAGLGRAGLSQRIARIFSVEELPYKKRDVRLYPYMCELLGTDPAQTWLFDDSWYALETARAAGLRTVGVFSSDNCGTHEQLSANAEIVVDAFTELDFKAFA